jgi:hypothetical protein
MNEKDSEPQFVICVKNKGYRASLELRKLYQVVPDPAADAHHMIRVIDESGEDYLYPLQYFFPISLPGSLAATLALAA